MEGPAFSHQAPTSDITEEEVEGKEEDSQRKCVSDRPAGVSDRLFPSICDWSNHVRRNISMLNPIKLWAAGKLIHI